LRQALFAYQKTRLQFSFYRSRELLLYAVLRRSLALAPHYTAKVTIGTRDLAGNALDQNSTTAGNQAKSWKFRTVP
jgi:hypothetical protein